MAFVYETQVPTFPKIYNVEQAVGPTGANGSGDVKLVQYMIRNIYGQKALDLKVDGYIGPTTNGWIKRFQTDAKTAGNNVLVDGRIDRANGATSTVSKTTYGNLVMKTALLKDKPAAYKNLTAAVPMNPTPKSNPYNATTPVQGKTSYTSGGKTYVLMGNTGSSDKPVWRWAVYDQFGKLVQWVEEKGGVWGSLF